MEKDLERFKELLGALEKHSSEKVRLFLITRHRNDNKHAENTLKKFTFKVWTIDLNKELNIYFFDLLIKQLQKAIAHDCLEMQEYSVIDDELEGKIYKYSLNKALAFADVILNQLTKARVDIPYVSSLQIIKNDLWAYCIGVDLPEPKGSVYSFRKLYKSKIVTDEKNIKERIVCMFDTSDSKLKSIEKELINFDDKLDCVCQGSKFYILQKKSFEKLVGMEEEFKQNALGVIETLRDTDIIEGMEIFSEEVLGRPALLRKIANIARRNNFKDLDCKRIKQMQKLADKLGLPLKIKKNKLVIETHKDVRLVLQMLDQYYVSCMQTGEAFGSHAKTKINYANK